jgi:surface antigen
MRIFLLLLAIMATPAAALYEGLQCVPYARALTGVEIRGDAHTWWGQAAGRYDRGSAPRVGAVMSFKSHGSMRLGHIAAVRKMIDNRTVLVSHANWSTIGGQRGHIEENVRVIDVSPNNNWSQVRVWYAATQSMGTTQYPLNGFIYPGNRRSDSDARTALAQIIGSKAQITPTSKSANKEVRTAYAPTAKAAGFQLSSSTIAEVNKKAANEKRSAAK